MNKYFNSYRKMISLRGLTDHTIKSYSTYILAYFDFLTDVIHKSPEDVTWDEMRQFVRWLQDTRSLSDRTMNAVISQLRFFTIYVLHKPWDATQLPFRKFDNYLPYVPSQQEVKTFISTIPDLKQKAMVSLMYSSGLRIGEVCHLKYQDIERRNMRIHAPSCHHYRLCHATVFCSYFPTIFIHHRHLCGAGGGGRGAAAADRPRAGNIFKKSHYRIPPPQIPIEISPVLRNLITVIFYY